MPDHPAPHPNLVSSWAAQDGTVAPRVLYQLSDRPWDTSSGSDGPDRTIDGSTLPWGSNCKEPGCHRFTLAPSGYCAVHAAGVLYTDPEFEWPPTDWRPMDPSPFEVAVDRHRKTMEGGMSGINRLTRAGGRATIPLWAYILVTIGGGIAGAVIADRAMRRVAR